MAKKVMKKLKERSREKKSSNCQLIASCGFLEDEVRQRSKEEGVTMADSVETVGVDLRTRVKRFGAQEKARRKKCKVRCSRQMAAAAGKKEYNLAVLVHRSIWLRSRGGTLHLGLSTLGRRSLDWKMAS